MFVTVLNNSKTFQQQQLSQINWVLEAAVTHSHILHMVLNLLC